MSRNVILVNLSRCVGCWTCALACKSCNDLPEDQWRMHVRTIGAGNRMDEPAGTFPKLTMSWMPVYTSKCTLCEARSVRGELPHCVENCPSNALTFGDIEDAASPVSARIAELKKLGYSTFKLPEWEQSKDGVLYIRSSVPLK